MGYTFCFDWELALMQLLQMLGSIGDTVAAGFTMLGEELLLIGVLGFVYWGINKHWARQAFTSFVLASLSGSMLKNVILRRRPFMDHAQIRCSRLPTPGADPQDVMAQGFSCPSLHAAHTVGIYGTLAALVKKRWFSWCAAVLLLMVGLSRIVLGVHYPTDILLGWLLGAAAVGIGALLTNRVRHPLLILAIIAAAALPGWFYCVSDDFYTSYGLILGMYASFWLDDRFVHFENTRSIPRMAVRTVIGVIVFFALSTVTKLPFPKALLDAGDLAAHLIRALRYAVSSLITIGVFPMAFPLIDRIVPERR